MNLKEYTINDKGLAVPSEKMINYKRNKLFQAVGIPVEYWGMSIENFTINQDSFGNELSPSEKTQKTKAYKITQEYINNLDNILNGEKLYYKTINGESSSSQNLIYKGDNNSGKTLLSVIILKEIINKNTDVIFTPWVSFYNSLSNFDNKKEAEELENSFLNSKFAIIDGVTKFAYNVNTFFPNSDFMILLNIRFFSFGN